MSAILLTRRAAIVSLAVVAAPSAAFARPPVYGVRVDVRPLLENSGEPTASWVARTLPVAISDALASAGQPGTPMSVRIDYVLLGPNSGGVRPVGSSLDQMIGTVTRGGVERPLRASTSYYPNASDSAMIEQSNFNRVVQLCQAFADWIAKGY